MSRNLIGPWPAREETPGSLKLSRSKAT